MTNLCRIISCRSSNVMLEQGLHQVKGVWNSEKFCKRSSFWSCYGLLPLSNSAVYPREDCSLMELYKQIQMFWFILWLMTEQAIAFPWCFLLILKLFSRESARNFENFTGALNADPSLGSIIAVCVHGCVLASFCKIYRLLWPVLWVD